MTQTEMDQNLLVITAIEGYAQNHNLSEEEVFLKFSKYNLINLIREQYEALHTQPLEEAVAFAEDMVSQYEKEGKIL